MTRRPWVFRTDAPVADCWARHDMGEQQATDPITAALLWVIYRGSGLPFTVTRDQPTREKAAA